MRFTRSLHHSSASKALILLSGLALTSASAYASTIYQFTLTPKTGTVGGTVYVTFDNAIATSGNFNADTHDTDTATTTKITALTATLSNGQTFNLTNAGNQADIGFYNAVPNAFSFYANSYPPPYLSLQGVGASNNMGYQYSSNGNYSGTGYSAGTLVFNGVFAPVAATPEPAGLALLGTGLLGVISVARRRFAA